jgi:uncharacterized protein (TIGR03382 family)
MDKLLSKLWLPALTLGASLGLSPPAEACSAAPCGPEGATIPLPVEGSQVPANVPALVVRAPWLGTVITEGADSPRLLRGDGSAVAARVQGRGTNQPEYLVVPEVPLVSGESYRLEARGACAYDGSSAPVSATFTTGPTRPLPQTSGWLDVSLPGQGMLQVGNDASCAARVEAAFVQLRFRPAPELVPFLPWVHFRLEVDGQRWAEASYGELGPMGTPLVDRPVGLPLQPRSLFRVHALCGENTTGSDEGVAPGRHHLALYPILAGATPRVLPAVEGDVELTCPPVEPLPPDVPPWGCSQAGGGSVLALAGLLAGALLRRRRT